MNRRSDACNNTYTYISKKSVLDKFYKKEYNDLLFIIKQLKFDRYHLIVLSAQKNNVPNLHPEIWKKTYRVNQEKVKFFKRKNRIGSRIVFPENFAYNNLYYDVLELLNNRYTVLTPSRNSILLFNKIGKEEIEKLKEIDKDIERRIEYFEIDGRRVAIVSFGYFVTEGNCVKLFFTKINKNTSLKSQLSDGIKELVEKEFILIKDIKADTFDKYLNYFGFNQIELNTFFQNYQLFKSLKLFYDYEGMRDLEAKKLFKKLGIRNPEKSLESLKKLNQYITSFYIWVNDSSDLYCYNINAKNEKRNYSINGDIFKFELRLKRLSFKNNKKADKDFELLENIQGSPIEKKVKHAISLPFINLEKENSSIISFQLAESLIRSIRKSRKQKLRIEFCKNERCKVG